MNLNTNVKIVYQDNQQTKVLKGLLIAEDGFSFTVLLENSKEVVIGKAVLIKATYDDKRFDESKY
jgi:hypothetical protein